MVRCRPLNSKELSDKRASIVNVDSDSGQIVLKNSKSSDTKQFTFDAVFDGTSKQEAVFASVAQPIIDCVMNGTMALSLHMGRQALVRPTPWKANLPKS
jgi:kinesin family protein 3/17